MQGLAQQGLDLVLSYQPLVEKTMFAPHVPFVTDAFEVCLLLTTLKARRGRRKWRGLSVHESACAGWFRIPHFCNAPAFADCGVRAERGGGTE